MRILIADDHDLLRDTLAFFFQQVTGIDPITAANFADAREKVQHLGPFDIVVLDLGMPGMDGLRGLREALTWEGARAVALMSGNASNEVIQATIDMGAAGFLPKTLAARTLANAVRFMAMGEKYLPIDFMRKPQAEPNALTRLLSPRELQVLLGIAAGKSNKLIARDLDVVEPTVKMHLKALYRKLNTANRTQAAMMAKEAGLV